MIKDDETLSTVSLICDIIKSEMGLADERVHVYNQKFNIPPDDGLFITVSFLGADVMSNRNWIDAAGLLEIQDLNQREMIQIKIMSRNEDALFKKERVLMALASNFSIQVQEKNSFEIARIPQGFQDVSEVEATARLNAYAITIPVLAWYRLEKAIATYNQFPVELSEEDQKNPSGPAKKTTITQNT